MKTPWMTLIASILALPLCAAEMGDDGLHKAPWMRDTFKDLREDLEEANGEDKRLLILIEQRGCIYCRKMHEEVFVVPEIATMLEDQFFVVQINMFGDVEVTDFDGVTLSEKDMVKRWGALFTPNMIFLPQDVDEDATAVQAAVANMPGAFGKHTTKNLLSWVLEEGYNGDEPFQKYHARKFSEQSQ
ncbi:thioredoxin family protein [uncultured Shimia sp.]|uniref:SoxW family protein n=1 Tax=uncultured Shimia sp. TaxID=573152 RepID=UPI0026394E3C|nr:thioredoxin family protein [uncultured Shimia sp.]